jgi:hypothetical protein
MPNLQRLRVTLAGAQIVGPAVSTFHFLDSATGMTADLFAFYDAIKDRLPNGVTVTIPNEGDVIDSVTGELVGSWLDGTATAVGGLGANQCPQGVGLRVVWLTGTVLGGRRLKGSTFMVPLDATMYGTNGLLSASRSQFVTAAANLVTATAGEMVVYSRPKPAPGGVGPDTPGGYGSITASSVPNKISTLRSRRV